MKNKKYFISTFLILLFMIAAGQIAYAEKYLVVYDVSGGMNRDAGGEKLIYSASKEIVKLVGSLDADSRVGVMVFGHTEDGCEDAEMIVPFGKPDSSKVKTELAKLTPSGRRGLIFAIEKAIKLFGEEKENGTIFVVTSGWDECGGRVYYIEDALAEAKSRVMLVVIAIEPELRDVDSLKEMASTAKGNYHEVENVQALGSLLTEVAKGSNASLQVVMRGGDAEVPNAQLKIFDDKAKMVFSQQISGFLSTNLETGTYDIQLIYQGKSFWQRQIFIRKDDSTQVVFDLDAAMGDLRLEILDSNDERIKGNVSITDSLGIVVYEGKNQSEYVVTLPEGIYSAEVKVGDQDEIYDGIEIQEEGLAYFPVTINITVGTAEIVVNNSDGVPVNAAVVVEDAEGNQVAKEDFTSTFLVTLPPGDYNAIVTSMNEQQETVPFYMPEGDNITVDVVIEAPLGSVQVRLVNQDGDAVFGTIRVYDERGNLVPYFERESIEDSEFTFDLPVGTYRIQAEAESTIRTVDGVTVTEGDEKIVEIKFPSGVE